MRTPYTLRHFAIALSAFILALLGGTIAFLFVLDESFLKAFYRATITISLTGLDTFPHNASGQIATIVLILAGMAIYGYLVSAIVEVIAHGVLSGAVGDRRRRRMIQKLEGHYIICGFGRVGRRIAREFREASVEYVILDFNPEALEVAREQGEKFVEGTGTKDEDLEATGIANARGLVAASDSDVDNLYIVVSARAMCPDLLIVARASTEHAASKMRSAGADRIVQPYTAAGQEMAKLVLKPQVAAFLDIATSAAGPDIRMEEIEVTTTCGKSGMSIRKLAIRRETGALIVALRKPDGTFDTTPSPDTMLETGDVLIAVGTAGELQTLEELFNPQQAVAS